MAQTVEDLLVRIDASTEQLRREMARAEHNTSQATTKMNRHLARLDQATASVNRTFAHLGKTLAPLMGAAGVSMFGRMAQQAISSTAALSENADTAGVTAERYQELTKAFSDLGGVAENTTGEALRRFNRRLGQAAEDSGAAADTFDQLGITLETAAGGMRSTQAVLDETIQELASIESDSRRAARASEVFGEEAGPKLAAVLGQGEDAIQRQIQALQEQGRVLDNETVAAARQANDELNRMRDTISTGFNRQIVENAEALQSVAGALSSIAEVGVKAVGVIGELGTKLGEGAAQLTGGRTIADEIAHLERRLETLRAQRENVPESGWVDWLFADEQLDQQIAAAEARLAELRDTMSRLGDQGKDTAIKLDKITVESEALGKAITDLPPIPNMGIPDDQITSIEALANQWTESREEGEKLLRDLDPLTQATHSYRESMESLNRVRELGLVTDKRYLEIQQRLHGQLEEQVDAYSGLGDTVGEANEKMSETARQIQRSWDQAMEGVQDALADTFEDMFRDGIQSFDDFGDRLVDISRRMAAEIAAAVSTPIMEPATGGMELPA